MAICLSDRVDFSPIKNNGFISTASKININGFTKPLSPFDKIKEDYLNTPVTVTIDYYGASSVHVLTRDTIDNTLKKSGIKLCEFDIISASPSDIIQENQTITITKIENKSSTENEAIPFETETIKSDDMLIGEKQLFQKGQDGLKTCTYITTYINDNPWQKNKRSESITFPAINEIIKVGTKNFLEIQNVDLQNENSVLLKTKADDDSFQLPKIKLSDHDRDLLERLLTGEFGSSFTGAALVAQAIKCAIVYDHYTSMEDLIIGMGYVGNTDQKSQNAVYAAKYIFDENALAVKHRLFYMCTDDYYDSEPGNFHSTQNFILQYENVKFFDRW